VSASVRQIFGGWSGASAANFFSQSPTLTTLAGSTLVAITTCPDNADSPTYYPSSMTDPVNGGWGGGTYGVANLVLDNTAGAQSAGIIVLPNALSVSTAQSFTSYAMNALSGGAPQNADFQGAIILEITGAATSSLMAAVVGQNQTVASTTTNAITSGNYSAGSSAGLMIGVSINQTANGATPAPVVGTNVAWASEGTNNYWVDGSNLATIEIVHLANPGTMAADFTSHQATSDTYTNFVFGILDAISNNATVAWVT
jgi:hypothetical protein